MKKAYVKYVKNFLQWDIGELPHGSLAEIPSKVVAIDRYVPAYIAPHILREIMERSGGVSLLVHQGFFLLTG